MLRYPTASSDAVRSVMRANRKRDTGPELAIRRLLHARGYRYRLNQTITAAERRVRPDLVFAGLRIAVFVDGCFWHGCPRHGTRPRKNRDYWQAKIARNKQRDRSVTRALARAGWTVVRAWEHETAEAVVGRVAAAIAAGKKGAVARE